MEGQISSIYNEVKYTRQRLAGSEHLMNNVQG